MTKTVFVRLIEAEDKGAAMRSALRIWKERGEADGVYEAKAESFEKVPGAPFAYWVGDRVRDLFDELPPLASEGREVKVGLQTSDDFRFLRLWWEVDGRKKGEGKKWVPFAKGGKYSPYYADIHLVVNWEEDGAEIRNFFNPKTGRLASRPQNTDFYFRPGLTWPLRTDGLSFRFMPAGGVFGHKGPGAFVAEDDPGILAALCAYLNSRAFAGLVATQLARTELAQSYEVGLVGTTPMPNLPKEAERRLRDVALRGWTSQRWLDTGSSASHAFIIPTLAFASGTGIDERVNSADARRAEHVSVLAEVEEEVSEACLALFQLDERDRDSISGPVIAAETTGGSRDEEEEEDELEGPDPRIMVSALLEWTLGVSFGRFDIRLATGERPIPEDPDPFDPLPICSPGMLQDENGLPATQSPSSYLIDVAWDGVLVDDEGHPRDIVRAIRNILHLVSDGHDWTLEAEEILGRDLRDWVRRSLFDDHVKRYCKSRRKAPIFWRLGTPSGSYSVWLYYPRATGDTLYRVMNEYVDPKLRHEESALLRLRQEAGASPTASQQKGIEAQEELVSEVQAMKAELEVLARLWSPEFDDGVVLNYAPFWRLVAHSRSWQKEVKKHWDKLVAGEYDWSHTAMRLWPERVVPACAEDRSFAIAHGLDEEFFPEKKGEEEGGATRVRESDRIERLVEERTSQAVKQALETLVSR